MIITKIDKFITWIQRKLSCFSKTSLLNSQLPDFALNANWRLNLVDFTQLICVYDNVLTELCQQVMCTNEKVEGFK